jgi:formylglycine-generating enzyme required for sulfatase activity
MKTATCGVFASLAAMVLIELIHAAPPADATGKEATPNSKVITNSIGMKLVLIPAGKFLMGSPADEAEREEGEVQHEVTITRPFYMGMYPVTQREYEQLMGEMLKKKPWWRAHFTEAKGGGADHPMENINWERMMDFITKLTALPEEKGAGRVYRLPTEAEWEYACRAGTTTPFYFGSSLTSNEANFNGNFPYGSADKGPYLRKSTKVGSYPPNAYGLYDMHGNVFQWCSDWYDKDYYRKSPKEDPKGPANGVVDTGYKNFYRVIRGGSWLDEGRACRAAYRFRAMPSDAYMIVGFRVVCEAPARTR